MESLALLKKDYYIDEDISYKELVRKINEQLTELKQIQRYTLSKQEEDSIKMMDMDEKMELLLDNQIETRKNIDILLERWA